VRLLVVEKNDDSDNNRSGSGNYSKVPKLLGTFVGHTGDVTGVVEKGDGNTLITASDVSLIEWNMTSYQSTNTVTVSSPLTCMIMTKNNSSVVCGSYYGMMEFRRLSDLHLITSYFKAHKREIGCLCELKDGSIISASFGEMKRWDTNGGLMQTFQGHTERICRVIELKSNVILSASVNRTGEHSDSMIKLWDGCSGECLRTITVPSFNISISRPIGLLRLSIDKFATGSLDGGIRVWDSRGNCIETIQTRSFISIMLRVGDAIVTGGMPYGGEFEFRQLKK